VRRILDDGSCRDISIFASGSLDEFKLQEMLAKGAPIDGFGIGTRLDTSRDAPYLDCAYKLMEYAGIPRRKLSEGKATLPGRKQVYRSYGVDGRMCGDVLTLEGDEHEGEALIQPVMSDGQRLQEPETLERIRERVSHSLERLPDSLRKLQLCDEYKVSLSPALRNLVADGGYDLR
jgi:nicotinate phosphoribosyltransferase